MADDPTQDESVSRVTSEDRPYEVPRLTEAEINQLAQDILGGQIVTSDQVGQAEGPRMVGMVFLVAALGGLNGIKDEDVEKIILWEHMDKAGDRGVNGWPIFMSMRISYREDFAKAIDKARLAYEAIHGPLPEPEPEAATGG